jgi:hypothetical protein
LNEHTVLGSLSTDDATPPTPPDAVMPHEVYLIIGVLVLWLWVVRNFMRTYARVTFVNDKQYGSYARPMCAYDHDIRANAQNRVLRSTPNALLKPVLTGLC